MPQQEDVKRETYIALRARREAYHVASDMIYEAPIDVRTVACGGCGGWIEVRGRTITDPLTCPACKARTPLPPYLRAGYMPRAIRRRVTPESYEDWANDLMVDEPWEPVPRWLVWFSVMLLTLLVGSAAALLGR